jgi:hypothetical protein
MLAAMLRTTRSAIKRLIFRQRIGTRLHSPPFPTITFLLLSGTAILLNCSTHLVCDRTLLNRLHHILIHLTMVNPPFKPRRLCPGDWELYLNQVLRRANITWHNRYEVGGGSTSLDYQAAHQCGIFKQIPPQDPRNYPVFVYDHEWSLPFPKLAYVYLKRAIPWEDDLANRIRHAPWYQAVGMAPPSIEPLATLTSTWRAVKIAPDPKYALMNYIRDRAPRLAAMEAWICMYRHALTSYYGVHYATNNVLADAWRAEPFYKLRKDSQGRIRGVAFHNGEPIVRDAITDYERARNILWDEFICDPNLRKEYLNNYIPRFEYKIFMNNVTNYEMDPANWTKNYRPRLEGNHQFDAPSAFPLSSPECYEPDTDDSNDGSSDRDLEVIDTEGIEDINTEEIEPNTRNYNDMSIPISPISSTDRSEPSDIYIGSAQSSPMRSNHSSPPPSPPSLATGTSNIKDEEDDIRNDGKPANKLSPFETDVSPPSYDGLTLTRHTDLTRPIIPFIHVNGYPLSAQSKIRSYLFAVPNGCSKIPGVGHYHNLFGDHLPPDRRDSFNPFYKYPSMAVTWQNGNSTLLDRLIAMRSDDKRIVPSMNQVIQVLSAASMDNPPISETTAVPTAATRSDDPTSIDEDPSFTDLPELMPLEPRPHALPFQRLAVPGSPSCPAVRPPTPIVSPYKPIRSPTQPPYVRPRPPTPFLFPDHSTEINDEGSSHQSRTSPLSASQVIRPDTPMSTNEDDHVSPESTNATHETSANGSRPTFRQHPTQSNRSINNFARSPPSSSESDSDRPSTPDLSDSRTFFLAIVTLILSWLTSMLVLISSTIIVVR